MSNEQKQYLFDILKEISEKYKELSKLFDDLSTCVNIEDFDGVDNWEE